MADSPRVVIITGGSGGLGQALSKLHLDLHDIVVITGRNLTKLEEAKVNLGSPANLYTYALKVDDNEAVRAFCAWIKIRFERCDILYNNAGSAVFKPFLEMSVDEINETLAVNLDGVIYMTRAFLPMMLDRRSGHIVNIASLAGRVASAKASVYAASKAAVIRFSESLRQEIAGSGISVTCVLPGPIDTPFLESADITGTYRKKVSRFLLSPEKTADIILHAVKSGKAEVALPFRLHLLSIMYQLLPASIKRWISPLINRK